MKQVVEEKYLVSSFLIFFLIHSSQTGIGLLTFQRIIIEDAGYDAWISVIITGLSVHLLMWMIFKMFKSPTNDVISVHQFCFGNFIGNILSILLAAYFLLLAITVFRTYIDIIQVWVFPLLPTWELGLVLGFIIYYLVSGGFRVLTGISFLGVILPSILIFTLFFPLQYAKFSNLLPVMNHSVIDLLYSSKSSTIIFLGFETLLIYFPFIKNPRKSEKWAHLALVYTTLLYTLVTLVSFVYFSEGQLKHTLWPTLVMTKIIELPFLERFEYIFIFTWLLVIIPTVCIPIWCSTRILKKISKVKPKISLIVIMVLILVCSIFTNERLKVDVLNTLVSTVGFYFVYCYIPFLFIISSIIKKVHRT
ncbi:spore germination protein (amino acid permease) [Peribacillus simplex]|uniref:Spore germination protein (Amino acid permease) n=1 Tax=Peribacillus simplex TaxID=1478 RepID=A0A9X8RDV6_9BACI|nr:GerAB/ArcD/ProY family transporter [Peribacillus simplex]SIS03836.1 spore germination protein (amino acid permease) [Peribacillus simplex]